MTKTDFYNILCTSTPEELNEFISLHGKKKAVNAITFITEEKQSSDSDVNIDETNSK